MNKDAIYGEYKKKSDEYLQLRTDVRHLENELAELTSAKKTSESRLVTVYEQKKAELKEKREQLEKERKLLVGRDNGGTASLKSPQIESIKAQIQSLKHELEQQIKKITDERQASLSALETTKQEQQALLQSYMTADLFGENSIEFNENVLRQALSQEKQSVLKFIEQEYDRQIAEKKQLIQCVSDEYNFLCSSAIADFESDINLDELRRSIKSKVVFGALPESITRALDEPISDFVQRRNIVDGQRVAKLAGAALPIDSLDKYKPMWLDKVVDFGIPFLLGVIVFACMMLSGFRMNFVVTATNVVVTFIVRALTVCLAGGFAYFILYLIRGKKTGIIAGIIGSIIGFFVSLQWKVFLSSSVTDVVGIIVKILICLMFVFVLAFINTYTVIGKILCKLIMKIGKLKNVAIEQQEVEINERIDCYYALLNYRDVIKAGIERGVSEKKSILFTELNALEREKKNSLENQERISNQDIESRIQSEKKKNIDEKQKKEIQKKQNIQQQDAIMLELSLFDDKMQKRIEFYDKKMSLIIKQYETLIAEKKQELENAIEKLDKDNSNRSQRLSAQIEKCEEELILVAEQYKIDLEELNSDSVQKETVIKTKIEQLQKNAQAAFDELKKLFENLFKTEIELKESAVLSDHIYIYNESDESVYENVDYSLKFNPVTVTDIHFRKKPLVFLYKGKASIATELFELMEAVMASFYITSYRDIFKMYIMEPLNNAIDFKNYEDIGWIERYDEITKLHQKIKESMETVATNGARISIDEFNEELARKKEKHSEKYGKYCIVQFLIPREDDPRKTDIFNSEIWTNFETSKKHGFLPIFYISEEDWKKSEHDEDALTSKFISKLRNVISFEDNIWILEDAKKLKLRKYY